MQELFLEIYTFFKNEHKKRSDFSDLNRHPGTPSGGSNPGQPHKV